MSAVRTTLRPDEVADKLPALRSRIEGAVPTGAVITPFYDSLLVKVTAHGLRFLDAARG